MTGSPAVQCCVISGKQARLEELQEREREPARGPDLQGRVEREAELCSYEGGNGQMGKRQFPDGRALGIPWEEDRALG